MAEKERNLTLGQLNDAIVLLQKLVEGITRKWAGKGGIGAFEAFDIIDDIYVIIHAVKNDEKSCNN